MTNHQAQPLPLGLAYIAGYLDPEQHPTKMLDLMFADDYLGEVERAVRDFQPGLVGLSMRNLDNGSNLDPESVLPITKEVIDRIRSISDATIACAWLLNQVRSRGKPRVSRLTRLAFGCWSFSVGMNM